MITREDTEQIRLILDLEEDSIVLAHRQQYIKLLYVELLEKSIGQPSEIWRDAFDEYNKNHIAKFSMGCRSCWAKVLEWHKQQK